MRIFEINRKTNETDIKLRLNIDGRGESKISTGCGFLDHMLTLFSKHSRFDIELRCTGDSYVDFHHTTEDVGIALGAALNEALGDMRGITRYGSMILPMDEALILSAADISGRAHLEYDLPVPACKVGEFDTELVEEFFRGFVRNAKLTLHIKKLSGSNTHHIIEGAFKSVARSLKTAVAAENGFADEIPSTKGVL